MPAHRTPRWTADELAVLRDHYPRGGLGAVERRLPGRSWRSIHVKASRLGLRCDPARSNAQAPRPKLAGEELEEAIRLREEQGWSFARIGARFGIAEASACNAVLIALCTRKGFTPAERDRRGCLTEAGRERLRYALKKGLKGVDIQLRLAVSASCVAEQRRRYNAELKERGKVLLPPPGGGQAYSGVKLTRAQRTAVEALFLQGLGTKKITERTGVSQTSVTRIRTRLVRRLRRKGETLPGCDEQGVRHVQAESSRFITEQQKAALRALLLDRVPVRRAAQLTAIGLCSAYRIRDAFAAELESRGEALPPPILPGKVKRAPDPDWPPRSAKEIYAFRELLESMPLEAAKAHWRAERRAARKAVADQPKTFEQQLALVAAGKLRLVPALPRAHLEPHRSAA
jgi:hypothetical protein